MHIVYVTNGLPHVGNNGVPMLGWSLTKYFLERGHRVTVLGLCPEGDKFNSEEYRNEIERLGADVEVIVYAYFGDRLNYWGRVKNFLYFGNPSRYYPSLVIKNDVERVIYSLAPDAIVAVHTEALATLMSVEGIPCLGLMGDPSHLPAWFRLVNDFKSKNLSKALLRVVSYVKALPVLLSLDFKMLAHCNRRGAIAAHYSEWFRSKGLDDCEYFRIPIVDELGENWRIQRERAHDSAKFKIVLLGALHVTATMSGLKLFAHEIYPELCRSIGENNFEVHIIGSGSWPNEIRDITRNANVFKRGYVENLKREMLSSDLFLVPTPISLGIRVRVLTAFSYGQCIVAHRANTYGIPELSHNNNSLLGDSGAQLASLIIDAYKAPLLRKKLEDGARRTYEDFFSPSIAAARILNVVEEMVNDSPGKRL